MTKSATDLMQEIIFSAVIDSLESLKSSSKGMPNTLLRDINSIHPNATFADLPRELQASISASVRSAFNRLLKEGYSISQGAAVQARSASPAAPPRGPRKPQRPGERPKRPGDRPKRPPGPRGPNKPR
ncbi:MAG TPA: hypothetical protein VGR19_10580 [Allosphingosinicella sp.]|nr:hypothetical protein [Allosphingosinicella sp.]